MCQSSKNIQDRCDANFISSHGGRYPMQMAQMGCVPGCGAKRERRSPPTAE